MDPFKIGRFLQLTIDRYDFRRRLYMLERYQEQWGNFDKPGWGKKKSLTMLGYS